MVHVDELREGRDFDLSERKYIQMFVSVTNSAVIHTWKANNQIPRVLTD